MDDQTVAAISLSVQVAVGVSVLSSLVSSVLSTTSSSNVFSLFNVLQIIEMVALIELNYPEKLNQFYHGFEFTLMNTPSELNLVSRMFIKPEKD